MKRLISLVIITLLDIVLVTTTALWPVKDSLRNVETIKEVIRNYSLASSNIDVWALTLLYTSSMAILLWKASLVGHTKQRHSLSSLAQEPVYNKRISILVKSISIAFELSLLAKAVTVAILADELLWPDKHHKLGSVGLVYMYSSIVIALLASFVQASTGNSLVKRWEKAAKAEHRRTLEENGATTPLLQLATTKPLGDNAEEGEGEETKGATITALLKMSAPDTPILLLAFSAGAMAALGSALIPYYTGHIIDYASIDPNPEAFKQTTLKLVAVAFMCAIFTGIRGGLFTLSMARLNIRLRTKLFHSLIHQEVGFFDSTKTGEITSRLAADTTTVSDQISLNINVMFRSATQAAIVLIFMFGSSWRLTIVTFVMIPVVLAICKAYGSYYRKLSKKVQSELAEANSVAEEAISTMTTVKAHAAEGSCEATYATKLAKFHTLQKKVAVLYATFMITNTFLTSAVVAGVLYYGGCLVLSGAMSAGSLVSFMLYHSSLSASFQSLGDVFSSLSAAVGAADKVMELINRTPAFINTGTFIPTTFSGKLELRNVDFSYPLRPNAPVLSGFNLVVEPGSVVALCGSSGGGKSSIVKLLERFYLPTAGSVLLDDRDVGGYEPGWLRRRVALVSQEPVLYARSIKRNIMYGLEEEDGVPRDEMPTEEDVIEAAKLANAHEFISALPDGYETECGERGLQLSGGQKQRIAIARALVRRPTVLLLDEATSALDADSEALVQEALDRTMRGRTVLVIAHRLSTIQGANKIVVVKNGNMVEQGTHDELLEREGSHYAALVRRQLTKTTSSMNLIRTSSSMTSFQT